MPTDFGDPVTTIGAILAPVDDVFDMGLSMVGTVATTIANNPLLLLFCTLGLVGLGVGLFKRLISA